MAENVDIKLSADIGELLARLDQLEQAVGDVGKTAEKSGDVIAKSFAEATTEVKDQEKAIKEIEKEYEKLYKAREKAAAAGKDTSKMDKDLKRVGADLKVANAEMAKLKASAAGASKSITNVQTASSGLEKRMKQLGGVILAAFSIGAIKSFVHEYELAEAAQLKLLNALGGQEDIQARLINQAKAIQNRTIFGDDAIIEQQAFLAAQGRTEYQIRQTIKAATELSAVTGKDLTESVRELDASIEGNVRGLGRLDARIKELTPEQLRNGAAIDLINEKYKGFAETQAQGAGKLKQTENLIGDLKETMGGLVVAILEGSGALDDFNDYLLGLNTLLAEGDTEEKLLNLALSFTNIGAGIAKAAAEEAKYTAELMDSGQELIDIQYRYLKGLISAEGKEKLINDLRLKYQDEINAGLIDEATLQEYALKRAQDMIATEELMRPKKAAVNAEVKAGIDLEALRIEAMDEGYLKQVELINKEIEDRKKAAKENAKTTEEYNAGIEYLTEIHLDKLKELDAKFLQERNDMLIRAEKEKREQFKATFGYYPDEFPPIRADERTIESFDKVLTELFADGKGSPKLSEQFWMWIMGDEGITDEAKAAFQERLKGIGEVVGQLKGVWEKQLEDLIKNNEQYINLINTRIAETERGIQREIDARNNGYASDVSAQEQQLAKLQQLRAKALADQQRYVKQQQRIESLQQAIDLTSTAAKLLKQWVTKLPPPFGLIAGGASIAALYTIFQSAKSRSQQNTQFEKGGWGVLGGERHSKGGTIIPGIGEAEKGEMVGIFSRKQTAKYGDSLGTLVDAINLDNVAMMNKALSGMFGNKTATEAMNLDDSEYLRGIYEHTKRVNGWQTVEVNKNYKVVKKGNMTKKIYIN